MRLNRRRALLCLVDDRRPGGSAFLSRELTDESLEAVDLVQVRGKELPAGALEEATREWIDRLEGADKPVIVNDRLDVALAAGADGVHLGAEDLPLRAARETAPPWFLLGWSAHDRDEILRAQAAGASYAGLGAFFPSRTKADARALDPTSAALTDAIPGLDIPVLAIGGITVERVPDALRVPSVGGVAVSGAVRTARDPSAALLALRAALDEAWRRLGSRG